MTALDPIFFVRAITVDGQEQRIDVTDRVISMVYEDEEEKQDKLKLSVDNYDLSNFDRPIFKPGTKLEVMWGYPGNMSEPRTCTIQKVTGSIALSVEALDDASNMNKAQKVRVFEKTKRSDVAKKIAKDHGYRDDQIYVDDTEVLLDQVTQARMTDAQLLQDMASREGFQFYVDFDGFHFHERRLDQAPVRRLIYFHDPNQGDIISWNVEKDIYSGGKAGGIAVKGRDPKTKESFTESADNASVDNRNVLTPTPNLVPASDSKNAKDPNLNVSIYDRIEQSFTATGARQGGSGNVVLPTSEVTRAAAKRQVRGVFKQAQIQAIELGLELKGDPQLRAKSVVEIQGIGSTISGNYFLKAVHHKIGPGYTMTAKAHRDGSTDNKLAASTRAQLKVNTKKAPDPPSATAARTDAPAAEELVAEEVTVVEGGVPVTRTIMRPRAAR